MLNKGEIFASLTFQEWYSWHGLLKEESGKEWGIYLSYYQVVREGKVSYPYRIKLVDFEEGTVRSYEDESPNLKSEVSVEDAPLTVTYEEPGRWTIAYDSDADVWHVYFVNYEDQLSLEVSFSGNHDYVSASPSSVITMGAPKTMNYNPLNLTGLAHRYFDPKREVLKAAVDLEAKKNRSVEESPTAMILAGKNSWFEHQWGNFNHRGFGNETYDRFGISVGDAFMELDLWYNEKGDALPGMTRMAKGENDVVSYGQGAGVCADEILSSVEIGGKSYPVERKISIDGTDFLIRPRIKEQIVDVVRKGIDSWVGWADVYKGSFDGEPVGSAFLEIFGR
ncbi:hypothetical protein [Fulvitalea axinellae]